MIEGTAVQQIWIVEKTATLHCNIDTDSLSVALHDIKEVIDQISVIVLPHHIINSARHIATGLQDDLNDITESFHSLFPPDKKKRNIFGEAVHWITGMPTEDDHAELVKLVNKLHDHALKSDNRASKQIHLNDEIIHSIMNLDAKVNHQQKNLNHLLESWRNLLAVTKQGQELESNEWEFFDAFHDAQRGLRKIERIINDIKVIFQHPSLDVIPRQICGHTFEDAISAINKDAWAEGLVLPFKSMHELTKNTKFMIAKKDMHLHLLATIPLVDPKRIGNHMAQKTWQFHSANAPQDIIPGHIIHFENQDKLMYMSDDNWKHCRRLSNSHLCNARKVEIEGDRLSNTCLDSSCNQLILPLPIIYETSPSTFAYYNIHETNATITCGNQKYIMQLLNIGELSVPGECEFKFPSVRIRKMEKATKTYNSSTAPSVHLHLHQHKSASESNGKPNLHLNKLLEVDNVNVNLKHLKDLQEDINTATEHSKIDIDWLQGHIPPLYASWIIIAIILIFIISAIFYMYHLGKNPMK